MGWTKNLMPHFLKDICDWLPTHNDFNSEGPQEEIYIESLLDVLPCHWMKEKIFAIQQEKNGDECERSKLQTESETLHLNTLWRTRISAF